MYPSSVVSCVTVHIFHDFETDHSKITYWFYSHRLSYFNYYFDNVIFPVIKHTSLLFPFARQLIIVTSNLTRLAMLYCLSWKLLFHAYFHISLWGMNSGKTNAKVYLICASSSDYPEKSLNYTWLQCLGKFCLDTHLLATYTCVLIWF